MISLAPIVYSVIATFIIIRLKRRDNLNGLMDKTIQIDAMVRYILKNLDSMPPTTFRLLLVALQDLTGNLATAVNMPSLVRAEIERDLELAQQEIELRRQTDDENDH